MPIIDGLQYCNWSEEIFREMRAGDVAATLSPSPITRTSRDRRANHRVEAPIETFSDLIVPVGTAEEIRRAAGGRPHGHLLRRSELLAHRRRYWPGTGPARPRSALYAAQLQQPEPARHRLLRDEDPGITRMGREVIREMNRVGLVVDMSHSAGALDLRRSRFPIDRSPSPMPIPRPGRRLCATSPIRFLRALAESGGMLGLSLYPHHLKDKTDCTLESFCEMVARTVELMGPNASASARISVKISRTRWSSGCATAPGRGPATSARAARRRQLSAATRLVCLQPDFGKIAAGLSAVGFDQGGIDKIMGGNWLAFFERSFGAEPELTEVHRAGAGSA